VLGLREPEEGEPPALIGSLYHRTLEIAARDAEGSEDVRQGVLENLEAAFEEAGRELEMGRVRGWIHWREVYLAQLDGAFVVSDEGVVLSAARYIDATSNHLELPLGLGSRYVAAASVSSRTDAVSVAVSESSTVRMFDDGELVAEIVPELWLLGEYGSYLEGSRMARETRACSRTAPCCCIMWYTCYMLIT
jgi:DisA bacterial checkpoint controller nucleotide-binding